MIRQESLSEISDGRLYTENDMVRADTGNCAGCRQVCCRGMESSIILDPYDVYRLTRKLQKTFDELLNDKIEINIVDGIMLPNMKMAAETDACGFLGEDNRCLIHDARPGVCRLFPLGRYWESESSYKYILQKNQCHKPGLSKIKVKKWIDIEEGSAYEHFIVSWHKYLKKTEEAAAELAAEAAAVSEAAAQGEISGEEGGNPSGGAQTADNKMTPQQKIRIICLYTLKTFYAAEYSAACGSDFFREAEERISKAYKDLGME